MHWMSVVGRNSFAKFPRSTTAQEPLTSAAHEADIQPCSPGAKALRLPLLLLVSFNTSFLAKMT